MCHRHILASHIHIYLIHTYMLYYILLMIYTKQFPTACNVLCFNNYIFFRDIKVNYENVKSTINHRNTYCSEVFIFFLLNDYLMWFDLLNKIN